MLNSEEKAELAFFMCVLINDMIVIYTEGFICEEEEAFTAKSAVCRDGSSGKCGSGEGGGGGDGLREGVETDAGHGTPGGAGGERGGGGGVYAFVFVHICPLDFLFQVKLFRKFVKGVACVLHVCCM